ncbi:MAG TPA: DUF2058 domain-containing protein [Oleiagrimonas sp.]|nr:DUF2058 domain-containing protein [Oleiagrimonas sp.]
MRNPNPLQDQLLKAGLVSKRNAAKAMREQTAKRKAKGKKKESDAPSADQLQAQQQRQEQAARDRALAAERNAQRQLDEARAQARQIIDTHRIKHDGDIAYRFTDGNKIRDILVNGAQRTQLADGTLAIALHDDSYALLPRQAADKVRERDPAMIVLDHADTSSNHDSDVDDAYYKQFEVPDDLIW